ncbi:uncharacterized protein LOC131207146 [Anopheles bellator]|uniref:uncharacterized protein LOC131207146 n=1 Tax=Anopheles bellator TaxID=139047 RepID=UPI00264905F9|nr:uncharacterized protein LOC131207146 [Anopheles bellator]
MSQSVAVKFDPNGYLAQSSPTDSLLIYLLLRYFAHYFTVCLIKARKDDNLSGHFVVPIPTIFVGQKFCIRGTSKSLSLNMDSFLFARHSIDHFPDKFADMHRRRLRLGTVPYLPNAHVTDVVDGTELWLVVLFCEIANCTTEVMMASEWGTVFENGTKIGLIGAPAERQVDVVLGGLYSWYSSFEFLAFTAVHSRSGCTCIVPKPHLVTNWRTPFLSFTGSLWCAVSLAFLAGATAVLVVSRSRQRILQLAGAGAPVTFSDSVLLMIGFFMEQTARMPHELLASCVLFTTLMFAGFMIGSSYNGGLASTMIVPQYEHSINTAHELAETRTTWVGVTVSWIYSILLADQSDLLTLKQTFREWDDDTIEQHGPDRDLAIIVERMEYGHYAFPSVSIDTIKCRQILTDDIYWEWVVGMSTKTWPARARFDRMVHELKAFGLLAYWELIGAIQFLGLESQQIIHYSRDIPSDDSKPLRISNISGALLILVGGLVISAVVFFIELLWHRFSQSIKQDFLRFTARCFITK